MVDREHCLEMLFQSGTVRNIIDLLQTVCLQQIMHHIAADDEEKFLPGIVAVRPVGVRAVLREHINAVSYRMIGMPVDLKPAGAGTDIFNGTELIILARDASCATVCHGFRCGEKLKRKRCLPHCFKSCFSQDCSSFVVFYSWILL